jgi:dTDP-4-amino-4,6-dideoxygalactose transaminase
MKVPLLDLKAQYREIRSGVEAAIADVCESQHFVLGPQVTSLEQRIAKYSQSRHGIGVSSGTDALLVALMALEIQPDDEVITTPFTFFATGGVVARLNARPVFCDIDPVSYNLSPGAVRRFLERQCERIDGKVRNKLTGGTVRAIMPVHLFGQTADMDALCAIAKEFGLAVVEDAAQALGAETGDGRRAGSIGDIGCFSFFPSKNLGAFGDAGMCVTNDDRLGESLNILRVHGGKPKYYHSVIGGNFRLDALQAAVLLVKLDHLDRWTEGRQQNAQRYDDLFADAALSDVQTPVVAKGVRHIFNQYVIRATRRDQLRDFLAQKGVGTEIYYPVSLHMQQCFAYLRMRPEECPEAAAASASVLALPIYPELTEAQQKYVVESISEFYRSS